MLEAKIFAAQSSLVLGKQIARHFGLPLESVSYEKYKDGEFKTSFDVSVRGRRLFLIGSTFPSADNLMEMLLMIDAAKRASARHITAVIPYYGWARQDRKDKPRAPIGAKLIASLIHTAGATRVITMDLHADQIQGFFEIPIDHIYASTIFIPLIRKMKLDNIVIASPDIGGTKRANSYAKYLGSPLAMCYKHRDKPNEVSEMRLIGDVEGKNVLLVDDIADTGGTLIAAAKQLKDHGAKSVRAFITHPLLSGEGTYEKIENSELDQLVVTDSIPLRHDNFSKISVASCAPLFAKIMKSVHTNQSISRDNFIL